MSNAKKKPFSDALYFYRLDHERALWAYAEIKKHKRTCSGDLRSGRRLIAESKVRLDFCKKLIERNGLGEILIKMASTPIMLTMDQIIRGLIDLYFYAISPNRISSERQRIAKISSLRKATKQLLKEINNDPLMSMFPMQKDCYLGGILNSFYEEIPIMINTIVPWADEQEAVSSTPERYFAMMMVISYKVDDSNFLANIVNIIFDCENWDTSLANKAIKATKKHNKNK